jgi:hypothetical protein
MSGGYISCGNFLGSDKSGSAIYGVLDALPALLAPDERERFQDSIITPIRLAIENAQEQEILIDPNVASHIAPVAEKLYTRLGEALGHPLPHEAPPIDAQSGLDPVEAKWGKGKGWQYYCLHDLLKACRVSIESGEPICLSFD